MGRSCDVGSRGCARAGAPAMGCGRGGGRAAWLGQQIMAAGNDSLAGLPPKNSSWRTWMLVVLGAGPGVISAVAGSNGTAVLTEPRVAMVAQLDRTLLVASVYCPVEELNELVRADPREGSPLAFTTAVLVFAAVGQATARWKGRAALSPPPGVLVSVETVRAVGR